MQGCKNEKVLMNGSLKQSMSMVSAIKSAQSLPSFLMTQLQVRTEFIRRLLNSNLKSSAFFCRLPVTFSIVKHHIINAQH